jgi:hypothetical protein
LFFRRIGDDRANDNIRISRKRQLALSAVGRNRIGNALITQRRDARQDGPARRLRHFRFDSIGLGAIAQLDLARSRLPMKFEVVIER